MTKHLEYRAVTASGLGDDGRIDWQSPEYSGWLLDPDEAEKDFDAKPHGADANLTVLLERWATDWEPVDGPIDGDDTMIPQYRVEGWSARTRGGELTRGLVSVPFREFAEAEQLRTSYGAGRSVLSATNEWVIAARLVSPAAVLDQTGRLETRTRSFYHHFTLDDEPGLIASTSVVSVPKELENHP